METEENAGASLDDSGEMASRESDGEKTFFIPPEYQDDAIKNAAVGDIVKIRIVGKDSDGAVEAKCESESPNGEDEDWRDSLDNAMPESMGGKRKENYA